MKVTKYERVFIDEYTSYFEDDDEEQFELEEEQEESEPEEEDPFYDELWEENK